MRSMARRNYTVALRLDTKQFGRDLGRVIGAMRKISDVVANVNISVNGVSQGRAGLKEMVTANRRAAKDSTDAWLSEERRRQEVIAREMAKSLEKDRKTLGLSNARTGRTVDYTDLADRAAGERRSKRNAAEAEARFQRRIEGMRSSLNRAGLAADSDRGGFNLGNVDKKNIEQAVTAVQRLVNAEKELSAVRGGTPHDKDAAQAMAEHAKRAEAELKRLNDADAKFIRESQARLKQWENAQKKANAQVLDSNKRIATLNEKIGSGAKDLERHRRGVNGLSESYKQLTNTVRRWLIGYLAVSGLIQIFHRLQDAVFDYNATLDKARLSFTSQLNGDREAANGLIADLERLAAQSPFQFKDLLPLTAKLKDAGRSVKTIISDITRVGDFVARIGEGQEFIDRIVYAINQISTAGKVAGTEIRQLTEARVPAVKILADAWGTNTKQMQEWIHKGIIPADKAVNALIIGMGNIGAGFMQKQIRTYTGAVSNLRDTFDRVTAKALRPFYDEVTRLANQANDFFASGEGDKWASRMAGNVQDVIDKTRALITTVNDLKGAIVLMAAAGVGLKGFGGLNNLLKEFAVLKAASSTGKLLGAGGILAGASTAEAGAGASFAGIAALAANPVVLAILAGTILVGGIVLWKKYNDELARNQLVSAKTAEGMKQTASSFQTMEQVLGNNRNAKEFFATLRNHIEAAQGDAGKLKSVIVEMTEARYRISNLDLDPAALAIARREIKRLQDQLDKLRGQLPKVEPAPKPFNPNDPFSGGGSGESFESGYAREARRQRLAKEAIDKKEQKQYDDEIKRKSGGLRRESMAVSNAPEFRIDRILRGGPDEKDAKKRLDYLRPFVEQYNKMATAGKFAGETLTKAQDAAISKLKAQYDKLGPIVKKMYEAPGGGGGKDKAFQDSLRDAAAYYDRLATASENSADRQIKALQSVADRLRGVFSSAQEELLKFGITNNPLAKLINSFNGGTGLDQRMRGIAIGAMARAQTARSTSTSYREQLERSQGLDGSVPQRGGDGLRPHVLASRNRVGGTFGVSKILGVGDRPNHSDHPFGLALDFMTKNKAQGDQIAEYLLSHAKEENVKYVIWQQRINSLDGRGWRKMKDRGGPTANHFDHVHASYQGRPGAGGIGGPGPGMDSGDLDISGARDLVAQLEDVRRELRHAEYVEVPQAWGKAVRSTENTTYRFMTQTLLANKGFNEFMRSVKGAGFDEWVAGLRSVANELDSITAGYRANDRALQMVKDIQDRARTRGKGDDVFAQLGARRAAGGDLEFAGANNFRQLQDVTLRNSLDDLWQANKDFIQSEADKRKVLQLAAPAMHEGASSAYDYARAMEIAGKQVEFWRNKQNIAHLDRANALEDEARALTKAAQAAKQEKDPAIRSWLMRITSGFGSIAGKNNAQAKQIRTDLNKQFLGISGAAGESFDADRSAGRQQGLLSRRGELARQNDRLREQVSIVNDLTRSRGDLTNVLAKNADYYSELDKMQADGFGIAAAGHASEIASIEARNRELQREVDLALELRDARADDERRTNYLRAQIGITSQLGSNFEVLNELATVANEIAQKAAEYAGKGFDDNRSKALAQEAAARSSNIRALEKELQIRQEMRTVIEDAERLQAEGAERRRIYGSTTAGSIDQERALRMLELGTNLQRRIEKGEFDTVQSGGAFSGYKGAQHARIPVVSRDFAAIEAARRSGASGIDTDISNQIAGNASQSNLASRNRLIDAKLQLDLADLQANNKLTDAMRSQKEFAAEIEKRKGTTSEVTEKEIEDNKELLTILERMSKLEFQRSMDSLRDQIGAMALPGGAAGGYKREDYLRRKELERQFPGQDVEASMQLEKQLRLLQEYEENVKGVWNRIRDSFDGAFHAMIDTQGSFFDKMLAGVESFSVSILKQFQDLAIQILSNWVITQLINLIPGASGVFGAIGKAAGGGFNIPGMGGGGGGFTPPFNPNIGPGLGAGFQSTSLISDSRSPVNKALMRNAGGISNQSVTINHYGNVVADSPAEYHAQMQSVASKRTTANTVGYDARRTVAQNANSVVQYGQRQQLS